MSAATRHRLAARLGFTYLKEGRYFQMLKSLRDKAPVACILTLRESTRDASRLYWSISLNNDEVHEASSSKNPHALEQHIQTCLILFEAAQLRKDPTTHDDFD